MYIDCFWFEMLMKDLRVCLALNLVLRMCKTDQWDRSSQVIEGNPALEVHFIVQDQSLSFVIAK